MTKLDYRPYSEERAAEELLVARYGDYPAFHHSGTGIGGMSNVAWALNIEQDRETWQHYEPRPVTADDCLSGLVFADTARRRVNGQELRLIEGALAKGATYQQIGEALGHTKATAEKAARARHSQLKRSLR